MTNRHVWAATAAGILLALAAPQFALAQNAPGAARATGATGAGGASAVSTVGKIERIKVYSA